MKILLASPRSGVSTISLDTCYLSTHFPAPHQLHPTSPPFLQTSHVSILSLPHAFFGFCDSPIHLAIYSILAACSSFTPARRLYHAFYSLFFLCRISFLHSQLYEPNRPFLSLPTRVGERNKTCQQTDIHIPEGNLACFEMGFGFDSALQLFSLLFTHNTFRSPVEQLHGDLDYLWLFLDL